MAKRMIEIEDVLPDRMECAIEDVKQQLLDYLKDNPDTEDLPDLSNDLDYSGSIHEIIDSAVPVYTHQIRDIMYLYGSEIEQAFEDAGIGGRDDSWPNGWQAAAIYCYIEEQVREWYQENAQQIFDDWLVQKEQVEQ